VNSQAKGRNQAVLVVDDDELGTRGVCQMLGGMGYAVRATCDSEEALRAAVQYQPAVILVDLRMPTFDGHTIMRRLRSRGVEAAFVVISGSKDPNDIIDAVRNGASDYLLKPFSMASLMAAMGRAVELYEKRRIRSQPT
jgi:FixJ family two-component response regulator